jgi:hypothetical protein
VVGNGENFQNNMKYIVYITICTENYKSYIGVHQTQNPNKFDGYIGCGIDCQGSTKLHHPKTPMQYAVKKYGYHKFYRLTLKIFDLEEDAYKLESELVTETWVEDKNNYNVQVGGFGGKRIETCKPILQYSEDGTFVKEYSSVADACRAMGLDPNKPSKIVYACKSTSSISYGYRWKFKDGPIEPTLQYKRLGGQKRQIVRLDHSGNILEEYESISTAKRDGYNAVHRVLDGRQTHCKGFLFAYKEN